MTSLRYHFKWNLGTSARLNLTEKRKKQHDSPVFKMSEESQISWVFRIMEEDSFYSLYVILLSAEKQTVEAKYKFSLIKENKEFHAKKGQDIFSVETKEDGFKNPKGFHKFISINKLNSLFLSGLFLSGHEELGESREPYFLCEITIRNPFLNSPINTLLQDLENLRIDKEFSDVIFLVCGREFNAHRNILAHRSTVFKAMFQSDMKEKAGNEVVIKDIEPEAFQVLLKHIYTDHVDVDESLAPALLYAAEKYNFSGLKTACENKLILSLSVQNAVELLLLADSYNNPQLKNATLNFISYFLKEIIDTENWNHMLHTKPNLVNECLKAIFSKK